MPSNATSHHARLALPAGFVLEDYRIESVLGKGGFGITYLARDLRLDALVAIKELLPDSIATRVNTGRVVAMAESLVGEFEWALKRFREEARLLATLSHPHIVRVMRFIEANGTGYMVMERVEGQSLAAWLAAHPQLDENFLRALLGRLLDGLEYVHSRGLLHRDISPENIFLRPDSTPVLLDFGSARRELGRTMTVTSVVREGYSPIEQYQTRSSQGAYTDLYAVAGVMIRAITGRTPASAPDRYGQQNDETLEQLRRQGARFSPEFLGACAAAFAQMPQDRPQTVAAFRALLAGGKWSPPPPKPAAPPWLALIVVALVCLGLGTGFAVWLMQPHEDKEPVRVVNRPEVPVWKPAEQPSPAPAPVVTPAPRPVAAAPAPTPAPAAPAPAPYVPPAPKVTPPAPAPYVPPPLPVAAISRIAGVTASSQLTPQSTQAEGRITYEPERMFDGDVSTAWVEGSSGSGVGESVRVTFTTKVKLSAIRIFGGYGKNERIFAANNRVKKLKLTTDSGADYTLTFSDEMRSHRFALPTPQEASWVELEILEVYPGSKYPDTAVCEMDFE